LECLPIQHWIGNQWFCKGKFPNFQGFLKKNSIRANGSHEGPNGKQCGATVEFGSIGKFQTLQDRRNRETI
jgi:hypothetical protein